MSYTTKQGRPIQVRPPQMGDLEKMWQYINTLSQERTFIRLQGEEVSLDEEKKYLEKLLEDIDQKKAVALLAFFEEEMIGIADVRMRDKTERHEGVFTLSVAKEYRGDGIGSLLMQLTIEEAIRQIPELEMICLGLFAQNKSALNLYKKQGFIEMGRLPRGAKFEGRYDDRIIMYKFVRQM